MSRAGHRFRPHSSAQDKPAAAARGGINLEEDDCSIWRMHVESVWVCLRLPENDQVQGGCDEKDFSGHYSRWVAPGLKKQFVYSIRDGKDRGSQSE